jgi:hypothetical protein
MRPPLVNERSLPMSIKSDVPQAILTSWVTSAYSDRNNAESSLD